VNRIYAILNLSTGLFCEFNGRLSWKALNSLQSSFHAGQKYWPKEKQVRWKEQDKYKAVELTQYYYDKEVI
jgi:hypothetical protein